MNFKVPKQEVIDNASSEARSAVINVLSNLKYNYANQSPTSTIDAIELAITQGIRAAVESIVTDTYTDQEFEEDLTLRS